MHIIKGDGQAHIPTEAVNLVKLFIGCALHHELAAGGERHALAVVNIFLSVRQRQGAEIKAVIRRRAVVFKPHAAHQYVHFYYSIICVAQRPFFRGQLGLPAVPEQHVVGQLGDRQRAVRTHAAVVIIKIIVLTH